jgi:hypothetical protein
VLFLGDSWLQEQYGFAPLRYPVQLRLGRGRVGQQVGTSLLPQSGCLFNLVLVKVDGSVLQIEANVAGGFDCLPGTSTSTPATRTS